MWFRSAFQRSSGNARDAFRTAPGTIIYAIGDVHGRADLLEETFRRIEADGGDKERWIVLLGDYIDRGPGSRQVIDFLIQRRQSDPRLVCLRGNHEEMISRALDDPAALQHWLEFGGRETLMSYGVKLGEAPDNLAATVQASLPAEHREFMRTLPLTFENGDYLFVHAGVRPGVAIDQQDRQDLLWIREEFLEHRKGFGKRIVHGHTPVREPEVLAHRIGIDTGAYITGRLTCAVLEDATVRFV